MFHVRLPPLIGTVAGRGDEVCESTELGIPIDEQLRSDVFHLAVVDGTHSLADVRRGDIDEIGRSSGEAKVLPQL